MEATASGRNEISSEIEISATSADLAKGELRDSSKFQPSALYLCFFLYVK